MNYYNDNDKHAAQWLRNLITTGLIPPGDVDERSIKDVRPSDLKEYTQCHFFAGIGGWSEALRITQWPTTQPVWTGSCPCQSLSVAGSQRGAEDERHLWPEFAELIFECNPSIVFGEQVASKDGREWLAGVRLDLEEMGYAVGASDLCSASVGAPDIRQRIWWVADINSPRCEWSGQTQPKRRLCDIVSSGGGSAISDLDRKGWKNAKRRAGQTKQNRGSIDVPTYVERRIHSWIPEPEMVRVVDGLHSIPHAVRGYGNAINPYVAAEFIEAFMDYQRQ